MERTPLKKVIQNEDYYSVLTELDLLDVSPSMKKCNAENRKKGAKLDLNRQATATRRPRMTQQDIPNHLDVYHEDSFKDEGLKMISAAIAAKNKKKKRDFWNLLTALWRTMSREQQKM